jgi:predicted MPP superfamily phosphohydrolase
MIALGELSIGEGSLSVRRESHRCARAGAGVVLLLASDLHLRRDDHGRAERLVALVTRERPDAVLLGGDLVDSPRGHELLEALVADLARRATVLAVPGNHDVFWGAQRVEEAVEAGGGHWISSRLVRLPVRDGAVAISGEPRLLRGIDDATRVFLGHDPAAFEEPATALADLALAGHLHGGQVVLAQRGERLYPGALFYRYCGLRFVRGTTTMLVSRGVADTLPVRYRCPREVLRIHVSA